MNHFKIILFILFSLISFSSAIEIEHNTEFKDILSNSEILLDNSKKMTINEVQENRTMFTKNSDKMLSFGYNPDFNVWIKFTLKNKSNKEIHKTLEYAHNLTTDIQFFDPDKSYELQQDGLFNIQENRKTINPIFDIHIAPYETRTYYIKASSHITTLILKLYLWDSDKFYSKEISHQVVLSLFFGAMIILASYNLFIFFFTKDISYLFYVLYIFAMAFHHLIYTGLSNIYLNSQFNIYSIELSSLIVALPIIALALFTKYFLQIKNYPKLDFILNIFLVIIPASIIFFISTDGYDQFRNHLTMILMFYLIYLTIFSALKRNRQAYFILFGWCLIFLAALFMFLSSLGIFDIFEYTSYYVELTLVLEALVFSIALADKINNLQKEKEEANEKLMLQQKNETKRLTKKVEIKTKDLKEALDEKEVLLKELNHRVKNNMQTIVSLIRLQNDNLKNEELHDVLITIQNRINAMSHLHELLYKQENITHINAYEYFEILIEEVEDSYENDININLNIETELKMEQAIYCGLILNELLTNSFKYAFPDHTGNIYINLEQKNNTYELIVKDDGIGYDSNNSKDSLGLTLVNTLAVNQLKGDINIKTNNGVKTVILWKDYD